MKFTLLSNLAPDRSPGHEREKFGEIHPFVLKEHLDTDAPLDAILIALTDIGLEVEGVENPAEKLKGFKVAKVLTAAPHPQADKLQVLTVDAGDGNPLQVVCGAPNARAGLVGVSASRARRCRPMAWCCARRPFAASTPTA